MRGRFDICLDGLLSGDGGAVLLAVSGGIDSMVMADLFAGSSRGVDITVAHCNFHLRGKDSDADEEFVRMWAETRGVPFRKADFDTLGYASARGVSVEMAARELRYRWFASLAGTEGFSAVAVAHNSNDNAETLMLNLLRGTGLRGICGMSGKSTLPGSTVSLIRPLLGFTRAEILRYALSEGLEWREDRTNADSAYKRNMIRNEIFPLLEKINPSFIDTLAADMRHFSQVQAIADDFVAESLKSGDAGIDVGDLLRSPHWEYLLFRLLEPYGFNEAVIGDLSILLKSGKTFSGREFRSATHIARTSRNRISISPLIEGEPVCDSVEVAGPGEYSVGGAGFVVETAEIQDLKQPVGTTVVNMGFPFTVRLWRVGDWMRPLGMGGRKKKLTDMFGDLKFSASQKKRALVIADEGSHVFALLGYRVDAAVAVPSGEEASPVIRIRLI
ncbi:MAG: tRNA lysidine(34) synthetase TilS [Bacteroidales bacterium]|nr:tRNA lysidine(34) synthetase TilS [Bacteroidales bacterium]